MKAMILAAGFGSRLRPLTHNLPKALIHVNGRPLIQHVIERMRRQGIKDIIINVHHHAEMIVDFLQKQKYSDLRIEISYENEILETGGGIKKTGWFFDDGKPFLVHNVDVLTSLDFQDMMRWHVAHHAIATLAVRKRISSRQLLFNRRLELAGWQSNERTEMVDKSDINKLEPLSFMGIHIISPDIFGLFPEEDFFSIIKAYMDIIKKGKKIIAYRGDRFFWFDIGKHKMIKEAEQFFERHEN